MFQNNKFANLINIPLLAVILIAALLRVSFLSTVPNGFYCDEASDGYDSYSILKTLHDQNGEFLPLFAKALGNDYREALYIFITVPFIGIFGLNEFATRLPAALIGTFSVLILYYLVKEFFNKEVALVSALFLAVSPWHIQFSRIAFSRALLLPFFLMLGLLFFAKSLKQSKYLLLSSLMFGLSLYTYSSARGLLPIFILVLVFIFWRQLWKNKQNLFLATLIFSLIFIPLFIFWISPEGMARATQVGLIKNPIQIISNYLSYFSPQFLFLKGDPELRHSPWKIGQLYPYEFMTILAGCFFLLKENSKARSILFLWLLLYPIPAAFTAPVHALRAITGAPLFSILSGYGVSKIAELFRIRKKIYFFSIAFIATASLVVFCKIYFLDYPKYSAENWQYGIKEAITYAEKSSYDCVRVTSKINQPHILILFYTQYPPSVYQKHPISPSIKNDYLLGKYQIISILQEQRLDGKCLFIIRPDEIRDITQKGYNWQEIHSVKYPTGSEAFKLIEIQA